jgi:glycosyltransferase involved in cell wall biosynthesis
MKKIKILYGLEAVGGGALKHLAYLVTNLDKEKFDITVILSSKRNEDADSDILKIRNSGARLSYLPICKNINIFRDCIIVARLVAILKREKIDIIHAHSSKAGGLFRIAAFISRSKNILYTPHCFYFQGLSGVKRMLFLGIEKLLAYMTSYIIVSQGEMKQAIQNKIGGKQQILNINNAIDFSAYIPASEINETLNKYRVPKGKFIVGAIGRFAPQKDWETFIFTANEVIKKHPETIFVITGEGELRNEVQKLIFALGLEKSVVLTGFVQEIHKIFGMMDLFVSTSLWEGLPYVFLEAMKYKKPVIATDTGIEETIAHGKSGFITPVKDYKGIAKKICELIDDKQKAIRMGEEGYEILTRKYSFRLFVKKHEEIYIELAE